MMLSRIPKAIKALFLFGCLATAADSFLKHNPLRIGDLVTWSPSSTRPDETMLLVAYIKISTSPVLPSKHLRRQPTFAP